MEISNNIILFIDNYKTSNCSHLKGYLNYQLLKQKYDNILLYWVKDIIIENDSLILNKFDEKKRINKRNITKINVILKSNKIFFVKKIPNIDILFYLKKNNNILIHEIIDFMNKFEKGNFEKYFQTYIFDNKLLFDNIIVNSNHLKNLYSKFIKCNVIYHHYDNCIESNNNRKPDILYLGNPKKLSFKNKPEYNIQILKKKSKY